MFAEFSVVKRLEASLARQRSSEVELRRVQRLRTDELEREVARMARVVRALVDLCLKKQLIARGDLERALRDGRRSAALRTDRRAARVKKTASTARRTLRKY